MATPFSGEDLVKRGIFSSIVGFRINKPASSFSKQPVQPAHNPWQEFNENQPCLTRCLQQEQNANINAQRSLSQQLENTFLTSPEDIFHEMPPGSTTFTRDRSSVLPECIPLEQFQLEKRDQTFSPFNDPWFNPQSDTFNLPPMIDQQQQFDHPPPQQHFTSFQPNNPRTEDPLVCPNCLHSVELVPLSFIRSTVGVDRCHQEQKTQVASNYQHLRSANDPGSQWNSVDSLSVLDTRKFLEERQQLGNLFSNGNLSIEEFVKLVASTIKDTGFLRSSDGDGSSESPEEILRRRRQQNNEAAARYRRRRKEAKLTKNEEIQQLMMKNRELRERVAEIQEDMKRIRNYLMLNNLSGHGM